MPLLLEDLAKETAASNGRTADRLDVERRELDELQRLGGREDLLRRAIESAHQATELALCRLPQAEGVWRSTLFALRQRSHKDAEESLLAVALAVFTSSQRLIPLARDLWKTAEAAGATPERLDEMERAEQRLEELAGEATAALEHRMKGWQPADPERFARGLQAALEGKTVKADEALARFRRPQDQEGSDGLPR